MEFAIRKCAMLMMKEAEQITEEIKLPSQERTEHLEKKPTNS